MNTVPYCSSRLPRSSTSRATSAIDKQYHLYHLYSYNEALLNPLPLNRNSPRSNMAQKLHLPPELPSASTTLTAQCHCKNVHYTITLPSHALPLPVHICHCTVCRRTHGALSCIHAPLPAGVTPSFIEPSSMDVMTGYTHDPKAVSERFFCSTCGCHIGDLAREVDQDGHRGWIVATSIFDRHDEETFQIRKLTMTTSSPGGGLYTWLPSINGRELEVRDTPPAASPFTGSAEDPPKPEVDENGNERLYAECHCGGVSFTIPRPTIPAIANDPFFQKYIPKRDPSKWMGVLDACDDCRLVTGTHIISWTFVPSAHLSPPLRRDLRLGTMKTYVSSPGVLRGFCGVCGATVIYACHDREPTVEQRVVDVAVGLLRAPEGVLAEEWLCWRTERIAYRESGRRYDPGFYEALETNFRAWGDASSGDS